MKDYEIQDFRWSGIHGIFTSEGRVIKKAILLLVLAIGTCYGQSCPSGWSVVPTFQFGLWDGSIVQNGCIDYATGNMLYPGNVSFTGLANVGPFYFANRYASINAAIAAAGSGGTVVIPANYSTSEVIDNPTNVNIIDLRNNFLGVWSFISPSYPVNQGGGYLPWGNDLQLVTRGPADFLLQNSNVGKTTTTDTLSIGSNPNVTVGSTSVLADPAATGGMYLLIGRDTANEEVVTTWSKVDATHLAITCAKTHSGTTDIEQLGTFIFKVGQWVQFVSQKPSQLAGHDAPIRFTNGNLDYLFYLPNNISDTWPYAGIQWAAVHTGMNGATKDFVYRNNLSTSRWIIKDSTGTETLNVSETSIIAKKQFFFSINADAITDYHKARVAGCATAASAGATCTTTVTWSTAFSNTNYTVSCNGVLVTSGVPVSGGLTAKAAASVTFQTVAMTAAAAQYTNIECAAFHD